MRVVIDTNVLLVSISRKSHHHPIFRAIVAGTIELCISNSILEEYQEKIAEHWSVSMSDNIGEVLVKSPFVKQFDPRFKWTLIAADPDDDKFVDCAIAAQARFIVSEDRHFNILKQNSNPFITAIIIAEFKVIMGK